ncbi:DUF7285 family protein [Halosegnis longus]|uniref:Uncharacterized protein n=1 Tax=Halosegnis longus TaxID=2216012 RepID=A0AAJ4R9D3_9EURY|nr:MULTISPECIES: hypothetical protein [Halobacteriales]RNJ26988.1 hypothetical protein Nmn1133_10030 [Salella cibi]
MSRSSDRGQTDPLAALVAVAAVGLALSAYGGLLGDVLAPATPSPAPPLDSVTDDLAPAGVADPQRLAGLSVGETTHVSLAVRGRSWSVGPTPPEEGVRHARRRLPIRRANGTVDAGRIRVTVW